MAKHFDLVGSVYDKYSRGNKYKEEEIIKVPGITFNSLEDIDRFTAGLSSSYDLSRKLDDKYQDKNTFSIRVTNSDGNFYYKSVIYNSLNLVKIASSLKKETVYTTNGPRTIKMYFGNNELFTDAWNVVLYKILKSKTVNKDREWLYDVFGEKGNFATLINRYINGDAFDNETNKILVDLQKAFREYEVFRKYLTNKDKRKENKKESSVINLNIVNIPNTFKPSLERTYNDNSYIPLDNEDDYDKEEFFDDKELEMMAGDGNIPHNFRGRKI